MVDANKTLKTRHITMISLGGVIGTGLFVGTGKNILNTGPAVIFSYLIACFLIVLIMQMLGEMTAGEMEKEIKSGKQNLSSFATYANKYLGKWAGFTVGWLFWASWVFIIAVEAALIGGIIHNWFPDIPAWVGSVAITLIMTIVNINSIRSFGEIEYWISFVKVAAIIVFLIVGTLMILGVWPKFEPQGLSILTEYGGFAPNGIVPIISGIIFVIFSICGAEVAAIAAAESDNPTRNIVKAIRNVVFRLGLFFIGSVVVMVLILPWTDASNLAAPYANILNIAGLSVAAEIMQVVIFVSLVSILNSALYTTSRMLTELSRQGDAPKIFSTVKNKRGIPYLAVFASTIVAYVCATFYYVSPDVIFHFLTNCVGGLMIIVYIFIAVSQIKFRRAYNLHQNDPLKIKMWLYPYLSYATIIAFTAIYFSQLFIESLRVQFYSSTGFLLTVVALFFIKEKVAVKRTSTQESKEMSEVK